MSCSETDMGMIQSGNGACFTLEALHVLFVKNFDGDRAAQAYIFGTVDLSHSSRSDEGEDFVWAEFDAGRECHFFSKEVQLRTTVIGVDASSVSGFKRRKRRPSDVTAYWSF